MVEIKRSMIHLSDGRELEVVEAGNETSPAILIHNGTPTAAGLITSHVEDAVSKGLRLINFARPGYGRSTRKPGRSVADVVKDTEEVADYFNIQHFATWGISGGGPHALACAALLSDRVVAAACLAGVAPYHSEGLDFMGGMGDDNIEEFSAALKGETTLKPYLDEQAVAMKTSSPLEMAKHMETVLSGPDKAVFTGAFGRELAESMQESISTGVYGWMDDDLAFTKEWGFKLDEIKLPLQIWQGKHDLMVPFSHGQWFVKHLPNAEHHLTETDGHLTLYVNRIPQVHDWLLKHFQ